MCLCVQFYRDRGLLLECDVKGGRDAAGAELVRIVRDRLFSTHQMEEKNMTIFVRPTPRIDRRMLGQGVRLAGLGTKLPLNN